MVSEQPTLWFMSIAKQPRVTLNAGPLGVLLLQGQNTDLLCHAQLYLKLLTINRTNVEQKTLIKVLQYLVLYLPYFYTYNRKTPYISHQQGESLAFRVYVTGLTNTPSISHHTNLESYLSATLLSSWRKRTSPYSFVFFQGLALPLTHGRVLIMRKVQDTLPKSMILIVG